MSWKKYGGTSSLESLQSMTVGTLVTDHFTLRNTYQGNWDICGGLFVQNRTTLMEDTTLEGNLYAHNDVVVEGNLDVTTTRMWGNLFVAKNASIKDTVYLGDRAQTFLHPVDSLMGLNTRDPIATLDIVGNTGVTLNAYSSQPEVRNFLARNVYDQAISFHLQPSMAQLDFYVDTPFGQAGEGAPPDAQLSYLEGGIMFLDVENEFHVRPKTMFSSDVTKDFLSNEKMIIYGENNGTYQYDAYDDTEFKTGNSLILVTPDNSSTNFVRLMTEDGRGVGVGGGAFPKRPGRGMGAFGMTTSINDFNPAFTAISGNLISTLRSSVAFNKYDVSVDARDENRFALDINGPVRISHTEPRMAVQYDMVIRHLMQPDVDASVNAEGDTLTSRPAYLPTARLYALGDTVWNGSTYQSKLLVSDNGGCTWQEREFLTSINFKTVTKYLVNINSGIWYGGDNAPALAVFGDQNIFYVSLDHGATWVDVGYTSSNLNSIVEPAGVYVHRNANNSLVVASTRRVLVGNALVTTGVFYCDSNAFDSYPPQKINNTASATHVTNLSTIRAVWGFNDRVVFVGQGGIEVYNISFPQPNPSNLANVQRLATAADTATTGFTYTDLAGVAGVVDAADGQRHHLLVAVGDNVVSWSTDLGLTWTHDTHPLAVPAVYRTVVCWDHRNVLIGGDGGVLRFTNDGGSTWQYLDNPETQLLNDMGTGNLFVGHTIERLRILDQRTFLMSVVTANTNGSTENGHSKVFRLHAPFLFDRPRHTVLEASGNMILTGDLQINDLGRLLTNNTTFYLLPEHAHQIVIGNTALSGNTRVQNNLDVVQDALLYGNVSVQGHVDSSRADALGAHDGGGSLIVANGGASVHGNVHIGGNARVWSRVDAGAVGTGAWQVDGGASIAGNLWTGGNLAVLGNTRLLNTTDATSTTTGTFQALGGIGLGGNLHVGGNTILHSAVDATACTGEGCAGLRVLGGAGVQGNLFVGGNTRVGLLANQDAYSVSSGSFGVIGGAGVTGNLYIGGNTRILSSVDSFGVGSGAVVVTGGVGVGANVWVGGNVMVRSMVESASPTTGAVQVLGGVGVGANVVVGGNARIGVTANLDAYSVSSGSFGVVGGAGVTGNLFVGGNTRVLSSVDSFGVGSGAVVVTGGVGVGANVWVGKHVVLPAGNVFVNAGVDVIESGMGGGGTLTVGMTNATTVVVGGENNTTVVRVGNKSASGVKAQYNKVVIGDQMGDVKILGNLFLPYQNNEVLSGLTTTGGFIYQW